MPKARARELESTPVGMLDMTSQRLARLAAVWALLESETVMRDAAGLPLPSDDDRDLSARVAHWRDAAREFLQLNAFGAVILSRRLDPKSPASRSMVALAEPLSANERANLERIIQLCEQLETSLAPTTAAAFVRATARVQLAIRDRFSRADREDAAAKRQENQRLRQVGSDGGTERARRLPTSAAIKQALRDELARPGRQHMSWSAICKAAAAKLPIEASTIRHRFPKSTRVQLTANQATLREQRAARPSAAAS